MIHPQTRFPLLMLHSRECFHSVCTTVLLLKPTLFSQVLCRFYFLLGRTGMTWDLGVLRAQWTHLSTLSNFRNSSGSWYRRRGRSSRLLCRKRSLETRTFPALRYPKFTMSLLHCQSWSPSWRNLHQWLAWSEHSPFDWCTTATGWSFRHLNHLR